MARFFAKHLIYTRIQQRHIQLHFLIRPFRFDFGHLSQLDKAHQFHLLFWISTYQSNFIGIFF
jgi:hypothetical protein